MSNNSCSDSEALADNRNVVGSSASTSAPVPAVVAFAYREFVTTGNKWSATCTKCNKKFTERRGVTSAFTK